MKNILILLLLLICAPALPAQTVTVENRDGKAVIVTRGTNPETGETIEMVAWKTDPKRYLQGELKKSENKTVSLKKQAQRIQEQIKAQKALQTDLKKAIANIDAGLLLETSIPDVRTPAPAPGKKTPAGPKSQPRKPKKE